MRILIATTNAAWLGPELPTGTWLEEFAVPYMAFEAAGASIVVASPLGGTAPLDPKTNPNDEQWLSWAPAIAALQQTARLADQKAEDFDALFVPGGHGPMVDLANDPEIHRLVAEFDRAGKIVGAVCHGPAALVRAQVDGRPYVEGKRVSGFSNVEELLVGLDRAVPFLLETALKEQGAHFDATLIPFAAHVVRDGNLITGQNPASTEKVAERMLEALGARSGNA
jgi:putative intracellular protease/amidase